MSFIVQNSRLLILSFGFAYLLSACTSSDCARKDIFCVGLVTDTQGINDNGVNQSIWEGLQESDADHIAYIQSVDPRDYDKNIQKFVRDGYDVIVTSGAGLGKGTIRSAGENPSTLFIEVNQSFDSLPSNMSTINFHEDQAGFMAGFLAATMTYTKIVGAACEEKSFDSMFRYCEGFRKGALYADKDVKVLVQYRDGSSEKLFIDSDWGTKAAHDLISKGADIVFAAGGGTAQAVLAEAAKDGAYVIGAEKDQGLDLADSRSRVITSFWESGSLEVQKLMRGKGGESAFGQIITSPYREIYVGEDIQKQVVELLFQLSSGIVKTNVPLQSP